MCDPLLGTLSCGSRDCKDARGPATARGGDAHRISDRRAVDRAAERRFGRAGVGSAGGADGDLELIAGVVLELHPAARMDAPGDGRGGDDAGRRDLGAEKDDLALEQALLVLGGVVLEVLAEVAEAA